MDNPRKCHFFSSPCGNIPSDDEEINLIPLKDLVNDVGPFFGADVVLPEHQLLSMRLNKRVRLDDLVCGQHRLEFGEGYRPQWKCSYFHHPPESKSPGRSVKWQLYKYVKSLQPTFVLGSLICSQCKKTLVDEMAKGGREPSDSAKDPDFAALKSLMDEADKASRRQRLDILTDILETERVRYQISSNINIMSPKSLAYFANIYKKLQKNLTDKFCSFVAPGQEQELMNILEPKENTEAEISTVLRHLKDAFDTCSTGKARRGVLMLVPTTVSKSKVSNLFGCSLYEISTARTILKQFGACGEKPEKERHYSRLSIEKAQHFVDYLLSTGMLQEMAYGTTKLKFESGEKLCVSNTVLNGIREHAVKTYIIHCKDIYYEPLGRTSLLSLLAKMRPQVRKKLAGIDSFVVEGIEAFEVYFI